MSRLTNITEIVDKRLPAELVDFLRQAGQQAAARGEVVYLVGGAVRDLLLGKRCPDIDLTVEGRSVFGRSRPLVEATMSRIAYGLRKIVLASEESQFVMNYYTSGGYATDLRNPLSTIRTKSGQALITVEKQHFITQHFHGTMNANSIEEPLQWDQD